MVFRPNSEITSTSTAQMLMQVSADAPVASVILGSTSGSLANEVITIRDVAWRATPGVWANQASGMTGVSASIPNDEYTFLSLTHAGNAFEIRTSLGGDDLTSQKETNPGQDGWTDFNLHGSTDPVPSKLMTLRIGGTIESAYGRLNGYISEIIVYDAELNATERAQVEDYLSSRYVIPEPMTGVLVFLGAGVFLLRRRLM